MTIEKAHLVLPPIQPPEVAARVHQPHDEEPRLLPEPAHVYQDLEEVDLREVSRRVDQRHIHLASLSPMLGHHLLERGEADLEALLLEKLSNPRRRQALLALRPLRRLSEQCLEMRSHPLPQHRNPRLAWSVGWRCLREVLRDRVARDAHLTSDSTLRPSLYENLVPDDMNLIHPEHPPAGAQTLWSGNPLQGRRWITFRAAGGSLFGRRHHV